MNSKRREFLGGAVVCGLAAASGAILAPHNANGAEQMDALTALSTRRSVREFTDQPVAPEIMEKILQMAMLAPSAVNEQPWEFIVIDDPEILSRIAQNVKNAAFTDRAPVAVLACMDMEKQKRTQMGAVDLGMSSQNILLAAHALGLGAVFTGIYPVRDRMAFFSQLFELPDNIQPYGLIVMGYPQKPRHNVPKRFNRDAIHSNKW